MRPRIALFVLLLLPAFGQFHIEKKVDGDVMSMTYTTKGPIGSSPVPGAPYSAVVIWQQTIILSNGRQRPYPPRVTKVWRDSQGRGRSEEGMPAGAGHFVLTNITDPAAGYAYVLDDINKVAHRSRLAIYPNREETRHPRPMSGAELRVENLGSRIIEGVMSEGTLETNTFPSGEIRTNETWWSPELRRDILSIGKDPKNGVRSRATTKIIREEPDAMLFQLPADYSIDDAESFTVTIKRQ